MQVAWDKYKFLDSISNFLSKNCHCKPIMLMMNLRSLFMAAELTSAFKCVGADMKDFFSHAYSYFKKYLCTICTNLQPQTQSSGSADFIIKLDDPRKVSAVSIASLQHQETHRVLWLLCLLWWAVNDEFSKVGCKLNQAPLCPSAAVPSLAVAACRSASPQATTLTIEVPLPPPGPRRPACLLQVE